MMWRCILGGSANTVDKSFIADNDSSSLKLSTLNSSQILAAGMRTLRRLIQLALIAIVIIGRLPSKE